MPEYILEFMYLLREFMYDGNKEWINIFICYTAKEYCCIYLTDIYRTLKMDQNVLNNGLIPVSKTGIFCYTTTSIRTKQVQPLS